MGTSTARAALAEPDKPSIPLDLAKLLVLQHCYTQARDLLNTVPEEMKTQVDIRRLATHVDVICTARDAPSVKVLERIFTADPNDSPANFQLAAVKLSQDDYDSAMAQLLEIEHRDRGELSEAAHERLLVVFHRPGESDDRVRCYRVLLSDALH
jgi:thioredoxin-like negative regulator of GroEL